ncbi:MAG: hypothetical protein LC792_24865 [Actinobacteria bacterium]|nr:hypothetical protein [Actinomycetota bacterium]
MLVPSPRRAAKAIRRPSGEKARVHVVALAVELYDVAAVAVGDVDVEVAITVAVEGDPSARRP